MPNMRRLAYTGKAILIFGLCISICLISGCGGRKPVFQKTTYETEIYPKQVGYEVIDSTASRGKARFAYRQTGLLAWGQYQTLGEGRYIAQFRLMTGEADSTDPIAALSVTSGGVTHAGQTKNLALKVLKPKQVAPYRYVDIPVSFTTDSATDIEYRIQILRPDVFVWSDYVKITKESK